MTVKAERAALDEPGRRPPWLLALAVLAAAAGLGFLAYRTWFSGGGGGGPELLTEPVGRTTINATIATSGEVAAVDDVTLRFSGAGRVRETLVQLGQQVKKDDPLVVLESDSLRNRLATAETNLALAELKLDVLLKGASAAELATADQAVVSAQVALDRAQRDLDELFEGPSAAELSAAEQAVVSAQTARDRAQRELDELRQGPSEAELAVAEQGVAAAEASLASARAKYDQLTAGPSAAEREAARAAVASAEQTLATARNALENAQSNLAAAESALRAAGATYCAKVSDDEPLCSPFVIPLSDATVAGLLAKLNDSDTDPTLLDEISALVQANAAYLTARNGVETAQGNVTVAQAALDSANAQMAALLQGPDAQDVEAARAAVPSAEESLTSAQLKLEELRRGADSAQIATGEDAVRSAQASVDAAVAKRDDLLAGADSSQVAAGEDAVRSAQAGLDAAVAKRDDLLVGADPEDIEIQQQQIRLAQLSVQAVQEDLKQVTLRAPFDGTVAAIDVRPGDLVGPTVDALTLLTPGAMKVKLSMGETDLPSIKTGMGGVILFDAVQGRPFPILVSAISLAPNIDQGVVTYDVDATLLGLEGEGPKPSPGMNGAAILVSEQRPNVLAVPNRAVRRLGENLVVDVVVDGVAEPRVIKTGLSDNEMTEVVEGLQEGELVVVGTQRAGVSGTPSAQPTPPGLPAGIR